MRGDVVTPFSSFLFSESKVPQKEKNK
uniref:Uncharacterized protein n=1 Tax=Rhizophora mucronata TaxID=61149 RepID=A0A2P2QGY2_RHIMU